MAIEALDLKDIRHGMAAASSGPAAESAASGSAGKRELTMPPQLLQALQSGGFKSASMNRLTMDWAISILSADQELWSDLRRLRARSRFLCKNNQYARKFLRQVEKNVIGHGIKFQAKVKKKRGDGLLDVVNEKILEAWKKWSKPENCSVTGKMSLPALERFWVTQVAQDGEVFVRKIPLAGNPFLFALQFIDPDQVDHTFFVERLTNGNEIRMGVEVDPYQRPVAYHIWNRHPSEFTSSPHERIRVPATEILHSFIPSRINQTRGFPWLFASMWEMNMLGGYKEAEVTAARIAACKMGFFESATGEQYTGDPALSTVNTDANLAPGMGPQLMNAEPGSFESLPPGMSLKPFDPQHPNSSYAAFVKESLRGIASGLDVAYHVLGNDLEGVNFSSIRAGLLDERDTWKMLQHWTIEALCQPVYSAWLANAILAGALDLDAANIEQYRDGAAWHGRGWEWVDPYKDVMASTLAIQNGQSTLTRELAKQGRDIEESLRERKAELDLIAELGITIGTDVKGIADTAEDDQAAGGEEATDEKPAQGKASTSK